MSDKQTPGKILRAARELRGYQQSDVAKRLCLSVQTIMDLENDDFARFTAEVYLRGHMRSYARLVDADAEELFKAYDRMSTKLEADPQPVMMAQEAPVSSCRARFAKRKAIIWLGLGLLFVLIIMVTLWWQEQRHRDTDVSAQALNLNQPSVIVAAKNLPATAKSVPATVKPASSVTKAPSPQTKDEKKIHKKAQSSSHRSRSKKFVPDYSVTSVKD